MHSPSQALRGSRLLLAAGLAGALLLTGCASAPPPSASLQAAQQAISNAESVEAGEFAAAELAEARRKLSAANTAVSEERMLEAERFADQSHADAVYAAAKSAAAKAQAVNDDMKRSNATLVEEMQRGTGETQ